MKLLITGANGFVGKNLVCELRNRGYHELYLYDIDTPTEKLDEYTRDCAFVFHLAGVNRPKEVSEFMEGNFGFTSQLLDSLKKNRNKSSILLSSSIQAAMDNPYGESKRAGEECIRAFGAENGVETFIYRLPNVFGKWCRPNYNSAVATFCHNIAHGLPIQVNDPTVEMNLVYIDDVVCEFIRAMEGTSNRVGNFCEVAVTHQRKLGEIVELIHSFKASRQTLLIPDMRDGFVKKLYSTYLSYLSEHEFSYPLKMNIDQRGSFTEFLKTPDRGQVSINISKPGITKGNHWHHTKNEKFLVVSGTGVIRFRKLNSDPIIEYYVSGEQLEVIDIPVGYTHNIENLGTTDMVTVMWVNEVFDPQKPDTYFLEV